MNNCFTSFMVKENHNFGDICAYADTLTFSEHFKLLYMSDPSNSYIATVVCLMLSIFTFVHFLDKANNDLNLKQNVKTRVLKENSKYYPMAKRKLLFFTWWEKLNIEESKIYASFDTKEEAISWVKKRLIKIQDYNIKEVVYES